MVLFFKMFRKFSCFKYRNKWGLLVSEHRTTIPRRYINVDAKLNAKMFMECENKYAYDLMINKGYGVSLNLVTNEQLLKKDEFDLLMTSNWSKLSPQELFNVFPKLGLYCAENNLCISNRIFDPYIDTLTDNVEKATDIELSSLFYSLKKWPETPSIRTRNYIEVWAALDDECLKRILRWSFDEMLLYLALFFMINVTKCSDFFYKSLQKLASKAKKLTPTQVVQAMFYIGIYRKSPFDMHNLELQIENVFTDFTIDELAILSMGFFKSKTPIRNLELVSRIVDKVIENSKQIHEVSLASLLKVIRYSWKINIDDKIYEMLDTLQHEVPRLSVMCNVHMAIVGSATLTYHEECLRKIANVTNSSMSEARLKDLERLIMTYATFNYIPKTKECFVSNVLNELRKSERDSEINKYGRSFICCIGYLGMLEVYPVDLINRALCPLFLENNYGKEPYAYGRELLVLNNTARIFCKEFKINFLSDKVVNILSKKHTDYIPNENFSKQFNITERMFLDVMDILKESRGGPDYVIAGHILTHHQRGDIIICNDQNNRPVPVTGIIENRNFGLIYPPPDNNKWIVLVIVGRNAMIYKSDVPTGHYQSKIKELNAIGYHAALILWSVYIKCKSYEEKLDYFNNLIENVTKK